MLALNINNPIVESYFHQSAAEVMSVLEAIASHKVQLVNNSYIADIRNDIESYKNGNLQTAPLDESFWDEMDKYIDRIIP
jgi:hypothetical protein